MHHRERIYVWSIPSVDFVFTCSFMRDGLKWVPQNCWRFTGVLRGAVSLDHEKIVLIFHNEGSVLPSKVYLWENFVRSLLYMFLYKKREICEIQHSFKYFLGFSDYIKKYKKKITSLLSKNFMRCCVDRLPSFICCTETPHFSVQLGLRLKKLHESDLKTLKNHLYS